MLNLAFLICICFLNGLFGNKTNEEIGNRMQCIELTTPKNPQGLKSIFRSARKRPTHLPRAVTFKTDIGLSAKLVNELGGRRKAYKWVNQVIKLAKEHFQLKSLYTKVRIRVMEKKVYRITNPSIGDMLRYRKYARYPLGFFAT